MRNFVLILALAAAGYGGYRYVDDRPELVENGRRLLGLEPATKSSGSAPNAQGRKVAVISRGQKVDLRRLASSRGYTLYEFTADW